MMLADIGMALLVVAICGAVVMAIYGRDGVAQGGAATAAVIFGLFFLVVWAGGVLLTPLGPDLFGAAAAWLPFFIVGFFGTLLILAIAPPRKIRTAHLRQEQAEAREVASTTAIVIASVVGAFAVVGLFVHYMLAIMPPSQP